MTVMEDTELEVITRNTFVRLLKDAGVIPKLLSVGHAFECFVGLPVCYRFLIVGVRHLDCWCAGVICSIWLNFRKAGKGVFE